MAIDEFATSIPDRAIASRVSLSKWVNERLPSYQALLTAHEVARLTRRPLWVLETLTLFGRFPKKQRFRGKGIGWRRRDVFLWLSAEHCLTLQAVKISAAGYRPVQQQLDLGCTCQRTSRNRPPCSSAQRYSRKCKHGQAKQACPLNSRACAHVRHSTKSPFTTLGTP